MDINIMTSEHVNKVLAMSKVFYSSDALDHEIPIDIIERNIKNAVGDNPTLVGYVFSENGDIIGFSYVTSYYETEVGGECVMTLDLYIDKKYRGRGYATQFFNFVFEKYSEAKRFRLEVAKANEKAVALYKKLGYKEIAYGQMAIDKI